MTPPVRGLAEMVLARRPSLEQRFGRTLIPLRYAADWRSIGFLVFLSALFFVQWTGLWRHWSLLPLTCVFAFIACVIKHNHIHCATFTSPAWNRMLEFHLSFCTGQSTTAIIPVHNERHHAHAQTQQDFVRSSVVGFRQNWLNFLVFPFAVVRLVHSNKSSDFAHWRREKSELYARCQTERAAVFLFVTALLVLNWRATLLYLGVPWAFGQWAIVSINLLQHQDCDHASPYDHARNVTGRFSNWLFLNNGFHTAHHLEPALHWSCLPEFHRLRVRPHVRPGLNNRSLLVCACRQVFARNRPVS